MYEPDFYLAFSCSPGIGPTRFRDLLRLFGSAKDIWTQLANYDELSIDLRLKIKDLRIGEKTLGKFQEFQKSFDIEEYKEKLEKENVEFIPSCDKRYPQSLMQLEDPPIGLFVRGNVSLLNCHPELVSGSNKIPDRVRNDMKALAVVGTRKTTSYGRQVTESLVSSLVAYGFTTVSGLALGIDAIAHKTALDCQGSTLAVLGCGVDCCYPRQNQGLYNNIIDKGGLIISEYPVGTPPTKGSFPARNRIIAALSLGVLVTEAGADSGSLITADYGLKLGKKIFAVPGPITSRQSDGTSYLLKNGGVLVQNIDDILQEFSNSNLQFSRLPKPGTGGQAMKSKKINFQKLNLTKEEKEVLKCLESEGLQVDALSKKLKIPVSELSILISSLEMQGLIKSNNSGVLEIQM